MIIRPAQASEATYLLKTACRVSHLTTGLPASIQYSRHHDYLCDLIERSECLVAPAPDGRVKGFVIYEPGRLHLVYVRKPDRNAGVATQLLRSAGLTGNPVPCTYRPPRWAPQRFLFDPWGSL